MGNKRDGGSAWLIAERVAKAIATLTAGATVFLALVGYGYALEIEREFGIPHDAMADSWIHLVSIGGPPLAEFAGRILLAMSLARFLQLWRECWLPVVATTVVFVAVAYFVVRGKRVTRRRRPSWLRSCVISLGVWFRRWKEVVVACSAPAAGLVSMFLTAWVVVCLVALLVVFGSVPVMIGAKAGGSYLRESVMDPGVCFQRKDLAHHRSASEEPKDRRVGVSCIAVLRDGHCVTAGRVVTATGDYVVVFEPTSGRTTKVPTADATIEAVSDLDAGLPDDCLSEGVHR